MISDVYRLTPMQLGMLFHSLMDKESNAYFEQVLFSLKGEIDCQLLEKSFNALIERYDILRTIYHIDDKAQPLQIVLKERKNKIHFENIDHLSEEEQEQYLKDFMIKDREKGFDLTRDMLMRLSLLKTGTYSNKLIWSFHHIIMDGWCLGIIFKELSQVYDSFKRGEPLRLDPGTPYVHYIKWLEKQDKEQGLKYWRKYLEGVEEQTGMDQFGQGKSRKEGKYEVGTYAFKLDQEKTTCINKIAAENNTTINTIFQTLWGILLHCYNNTNDVVYGIVVSGRPPEVEGIETMVGLFINTIPVRITLDGERTFSHLLQNIQKIAAVTKPYEYLPLAEIQAQSSLKNKLIDHVMAFENYPIEKQVIDNQKIDTEKEFRLEVEDVKAFEQTNYNFNILASPGKRLFIRFIFNSLVFDMEFINRTALHFMNMVNQVTENPNILERDIEIVTDREKHQLLFEFNDTGREYPQDKTIHELFAAQVEQTPNRIAVMGPATGVGTKFIASAPGKHIIHVSYDEIARRSHQLSHLLKLQGVKPDIIVAIMMGHSIEMIIGILGILIAAGAYLPIDPEYPGERIQYMLKDSGAEILLKDNDFTPEAFNNRPKGNSSHPHLKPLINTPPTSLAYIIYTSGSTGKPKGVIVEHQALANLCCWHNRYFSVTYKDRATKYAGFGFDASVWEIFPYIICGAALYIIEDQIKLDIPRLNQYFEKHHITISFLPTQVCEQFMVNDNDNHSLRILLTGGDKLKRFVKHDYCLVNNYGPTENTVVATSCIVEQSYQDLPIGKPIFNNRIYILNRYANLQPVGIPGELCIAGDNLARGYLNHPELTTEKFCLRRPGAFFKKTAPGPSKNFLFEGTRVLAPLSLKVTGKGINMSYIYKTGDLARWLPDGNIEFLARIDHQVKIRGNRIELGEIENQLMTVNTINEAVVLARENKTGEKYLCAYIVPGKPLEDYNLRETLSQHLPDYMIPSYFVQLKKLPFTPNGKIDRRALPEPGVKTGEDGYQAPRDDVEVKLADIWAEVLLGSGALNEANPISIIDNFFNIGGDSIKAIQIATRLKKFGLKLEIKDLFANPTIKELRKTITTIKRTIDQGTVKGEVQLIPIQQWFFENINAGRHHFNQAVMIYRQEGFDENIIRRVFQQIVRHHDALRMVYQFKHAAQEAEKPVVLQTNRGIDENTEGKLLGLQLFDLKKAGRNDLEKEILRKVNRIQKSINLEKGPLVKLGLFKTTAGDHLLIVIHHLVVDGVSWRILLEDFSLGCQQAMNNKTLQFPPKTDSFKQWAYQLKKYSESPALLSELEYWKHMEKTAIPPLPKDFEISPAQKKIKNNRTLRLTFNADQTRQLLKEVNQAYSTGINDILLAALGLAVKDWAGIDKVSFHLEGHGRQEIIENIDISRTVGWFTSQFPVLLEMSHPGNLPYIIKHIKETLRKIPNKGIGYGILKYLTPADKKDGFAPTYIPEINFNYLGEFGSIGLNHQEDISRVSEMRTGNQLSPEFEQWAAININGIITHSQLVLSFSYNKYQYKQRTIEKLVDCFKSHLLTIISHCVQKERKELTPSDLTYPHFSIDQLEALTHQLGNIEDIYELTPMQAGMLFHALNDEESTAYIEQIVFSIEGHIDKNLLQKSFNSLMERYDILRTLFYYEQVDQPLQIVLEHRPGDIYFEDIRHLHQETQNHHLNEFYLKDRKRGFDLSKDVLIRVSLFKTGETAYKVAWTFHHILMDGWCTGIIFKELLYIYQRLNHGQSLELGPVTKYRSYIRWLKSQDKEEGLSYWQVYLQDYEEQASGRVPTFGKQTRLKDQQYLPGEYLFTINQSLTNGLNKLTRQNQVTLNTILQTLWGLLLQRYNNTNDVVFGAVVSGRPSEIDGIEQMVGLFINTIPVRIKSNDEETFSQLIKKIQAQALKAKSYEYLPLADIQANSPLKSELIHHIMIFENYPIEKEVKNINENPGFYVQILQTYEQTNYDFNITVILGRHLSIKFSFNSKLYENDWVERIALHLENMLGQVTRNPSLQAKEIEIIPAEEKQRLLGEFNNTTSEYPADKTLHQCFADQVEQTPDNTALVGANHKHEAPFGLINSFAVIHLSYRELNRSANQLAVILKEKGANPDTIVGIIVNRSIEMIIGIFGILKASGAYLPIDPQYPEGRIQYILKDSNARILLKKSEIRISKSETNPNAPNSNNQNKKTEVTVLDFEHLNFEFVSNFEFRTSNFLSSNLAYIIYTSGSTGKPKGVPVEHASVVNVLTTLAKKYPLSSQDTYLLKTSHTFDVSVTELFGWFWRGGRTAILEKGDEKEPRKILDTIERAWVTHINFVPSMFAAFLEILKTEGIRKLSHLKYIFLAGEALVPGLVKKFIRLDSRVVLENLYGPTEATVYSSQYSLSDWNGTGDIPIGKPLANLKFYILDRHDHLQPLGVAGELCISGIGLARGYLNRPELSAEKFCLRRPGGRFLKKLPPWTPRKNFLFEGTRRLAPLSLKALKGTGQEIHMSHKSHIYKTGDLTRWLPDGNIEFLGRIDHQVKIRGFRIELDEIESQLLTHQQIQACAVLSFEDNTGNHYLCAYFIPNSNQTFTQTSSISAKLRQYLSLSLPDYMIPSYFISLEKLPLTPSGKLNRQALPAPGIKSPTGDYQAPRDDLEVKLAEIWAGVLLSKDATEAGNPISINDNFLAIGGDSIKAIQIAARLQKYGLKLGINELFANPTIKQMRKCIKHMKRAVDQRPVVGEVQLTPIQQWFFQGNFTQPQHCNLAVMIYRKQGYDQNIVKQVFQKIVEHHDALRMVYEFNHHEAIVIQRNRDINETTPGKLFHLEVFNFKAAEPDDIKTRIQTKTNRIQASINLEKGPLLKLGLFKTSRGDHLLIVIHHLVVDGISWRILLEDFAVGYQQAMNNITLRFPPKTDSFKQWAYRLKQYAESNALLNELEYWKRIAKTKIHPLPEDFEISIPKKKVKNIKILLLTLEPGETWQLLSEVHRAYSTGINDILLAALALAIKDWAGIENILIHLEGHGREEIIEDIDISRTVGWFTSQIPVLLQMNHPWNLSYVIKHVKETLRRIPNKGIGYGILRYLTPSDKKEGFVPIKTPGICFNYLGEFASTEQNLRENIFTISEIQTGKHRSPEFEQTYAIDINGIINHSQLVLSFSYNQHQYKQSTIKKLADSFKSNLLTIISHCVQKERKELTPSDLTYPGLSIDQLEKLTQQRGEIKDIYELTPMQAGMLFHALKDKESTAYFEQRIFTIKAEINKGLLKESLNTLVERYDILRTLFYYEKLDQPLQIVLKQCPGDIYFEDIKHLNIEAQNQYLKEFYLKDRKKRFDLTGQRLLRASLIKTRNNSYKLVWSFHHILMDGWCTGIIFNELAQIYNSLLTGDPLKLEPVTQYVDYIKWLKSQDKKQGLKYWQEYLEGYESPANLTVPGSGTQKILNHDNIKYELGEYVFSLDDSLTDALRKTAVKNNVTINTVIQSIWGILLQTYNQTDDVVYGAVVSGRPPELEDVERMLGLFINTVPVRIQADSTKTFSQLVHEVQQNAVLLKSYEYLPLAEIQSLSYPKGELIDHIMIFENYPIDTMVKVEDKAKDHQFKVEDVQTFEQTNYLFNMIVIPGTRMIIQFTFNDSVYEKDFVKRISEHLTQIVKQVTVNIHIFKNEIEIIPEAEKQRILYEFNQPHREYPQNKTIPGLFARQVEQTPDKIALLGKEEGWKRKKVENIQLSYNELNEKSNQLAVVLIERGVNPDIIVGLAVERSVEMIVGVLGILKSGGAYLPIDPKHPVERTKYMLADSNAKILVTTSTLDGEGEKLRSLEVNRCHQTIFIDTLDFSNLTSSHLFNFSTSPSSLAYVIYTSGTTGKPKGILTTHANVIRVVKKTNYIELTGNHRILQLSNYAFDGSVFDIYGALLNGAALVLVDRHQAFAVDQLAKFIKQQQITIFFVTTALFNILIDSQPHCFADVRKVLFGGEQVSLEHSKKALQYMGKGRMIHVYGPTEATVFATYYFIDGIQEKDATVPIGKPIANTSAYILDRCRKLVPIGVTGELFIGGQGLARGYLNQPELTAEKFDRDFEEPFGQIIKAFGEKSKMVPTKNNYRSHKSHMSYKSYKSYIYRTGDLARRLPDGAIEFLGRRDFQVKIRGFRIEPGEIEAQLLNHHAVQKTVVLVKGNDEGDKYLCAYIVLTNPIYTSELKAYLSEKLPPYMVPSYFIPVDKILLTPNGKIDRKALPEPVQKTGQGIMAPRNEVEEILTGIWAEVLGIEKDNISIDANFFDLGGHSLKATMMVSKIHKFLHVQVPLVNVFETPEIKGISQYITSLKEAPFTSLVPVEKKEYYPLCSAQKRMFILNLLEGKDAVTYNISIVLSIKGKVVKSKLEEAFKKLIQHHEALRTSFAMIEDNPVQIVHDHAAFNLAYSECDREEAEQRVKRFIRPFDLTKAPLLRVEVIKIGEDKYNLMVDIHHIVADGTALQILMKEFTALTEDKILPRLNIHNKDFAGWQNKLLGSGAINKQEAYWLSRFKAEIPILDLPTDYPRPLIRSTHGDIVYFELNRELTLKTNTLWSETGTTLYMVILAVYNILLSMYALQEEVIVGTPVSGRNHADLQDIIGILANMVAMKNQPGKDKKFTDFLKEVKENALQAYENQDFQFETLIEKLNLQVDPGRHPLFDVVLNVININRGKRQPENKNPQEYENSNIEPYPVEYHTAKYDLVLRASKNKDTLSMSLEYSTSLFKKSTVESMIKNYIEILKQVVENKDITLKNITISSPFLLAQNTSDEEDMDFNF